MGSEVDVHFRNVVERIFSNWTGLQMAVEHGMAGPMGKQMISQAIDYVSNYCLSSENVQQADIKEELEDILDEEFDTICEDDSPSDVAHLLFKYLQCLRQGNMETFISECNNLPPVKNWVVQQTQPMQAHNNESSSDDSSAEDDADESMDVDPGWTVVKGNKGRRKK